MRNRLKRLLTYHPLLTLFVMMVSAMLFGLFSFNLVMLFKGNIALVFDYGVQALYEGAFEELLRLFIYGVLGLLFYIVFKACEKFLVDWIVK
jgi:hypothetical protein